MCKVFNWRSLIFPNLLHPFSSNQPQTTGAFGQDLAYEQSNPPPLSSHHDSIQTSGQDNNSSCSSSTATPTAAKTVQNTCISQTTGDDPVIGQVTLGGRFTCLSKACRDDETLTFNRHADFKRHYTNMHARKLTEYFCPEKGCHRSRYPANGKKGRSFKGRRDKMKEHMKTVHDSRSRKRRRAEDSDEKEEDENPLGNGGDDKLRL